MRDARSYNSISRGIAQLVEQWSPNRQATDRRLVFLLS